MNSKKLISSPFKNSSISIFFALPNLPLKISSIANFASTSFSQIYTPLPEARLSALITVGSASSYKFFALFLFWKTQT